jgi:hypothetical protein
MTLHINIIVVQPLSNHFLNLLISLIVIGAPPSACDLMFFTLTQLSPPTLLLLLLSPCSKWHSTLYTQV